ncbi:MAG TPA: hypothetical protein VFP65_12510 [Anaeromyxobacteraceae bacterium]|nr:hypothetical protein [Anaeromyxobacteraceae bacterium]
MTRLAPSLAILTTLLAACGGNSPSSADGRDAQGVTASHAAAGLAKELFVGSAVEHTDGTVTLPLHRGTSHGTTVYYVVLDSSSGDDAQASGVNESQKLAHLRGSTAAQVASVTGGAVDFPHTVNFAFGQRKIVAGPNGFPPDEASPSAKGEDGYSPYLQLPNGTIENAPHVANDTGLHPKVVAIDLVAMTVTLEETAGFSGGDPVRYVSTDASNPVAAALENVTWAPAMDAAPTVGQDGTDQARTSLAAFVNGQTGAANPQRQGLNSAILDGLSPLNVLRWKPNQGRYSPLWDVHLARWSDAAVAAGRNTRQTDFGDIQGLADHGLVTAPDGSPFAASGFIVNCPIISSD